MKPEEWFDALRKIDLSDLDTNNIGSWPAAIKVLASVLLMVLVLALGCLLYTSPSPRDLSTSRMPSSA